MKTIKIENIGDVAIIDEFRDIYLYSSGIEICHTSSKPREILEKLKNDYVVILQGDYLHAQYILFYVQRFENELADKSNPAESKRTRLHRLNYIAHQSTFPMFDNITERYDFHECLNGHMNGRRKICKTIIIIIIILSPQGGITVS